MALQLLLTAAALGVGAPTADRSAEIMTLVAGAEQKATRLETKLRALKAGGTDIALPDSALAVAQLFCRYSRYDATRPDMQETALTSMQYVDRMLDEQLAAAGAVAAGRASFPRIPQWKTAGTTWHDGSFWSGAEPIFLSGLNWDAVPAGADPGFVKRLGINLIDGTFRGSVRQDGSADDAWFERSERPWLEKMAKAGFAMDLLMGTDVPGWLMQSEPLLSAPGFGNGYGYVVNHPKAVAYRNAVLDHYAPLYGSVPSVFAIDLANEPAFQGPSRYGVLEWREWLRKRYGTVAAMNEAWDTRLASFDEVEHFPTEPLSFNGSPWDRRGVDFGVAGQRGMHHDWCAFNNDRISKYFTSLSEQIHAAAPRVGTHVKSMLGLYFTGSTEARGWRMGMSYHTFGIDPEALARTCSFLSGDNDILDLSHIEKPNRRFGSVPYVIGWIDNNLAEDFLKSLAPGKPFYNSEFHVNEDNKVTTDCKGAKEHVELALWLSSLHGMSGNLMWYWGRGDDAAVLGHGAEFFKGSTLQQPWMLQGYLQESLNLRRFVHPVLAFSKAPRAVRLLYSEPSAIQDVAYMDALRDSYEALSFLGIHVGFVTERQLAEGGVPAGTKLVVVPNAQYVENSTVAALEAAARKGVKLGILGDRSLTRVPTGRERTVTPLAGVPRVATNTPRECQAQFDLWLRAAGVGRELLAMDGAGHPAWGIEVRTARYEKQRVAYLVNLLREPVRVKLRWSAAKPRLVDLRTGKPVPNMLTLQPRQMVFGAY